MKQSGINACRTAVAILLLLALAACSTAAYRYESAGQSTIEKRSLVQSQGEFTVRASVPNDEEAERLFGIELSKRNIQAVWLEIHNASDRRARFAPYSVDSDYFPAHEVAYMFRKQFSKQGWRDLESRLFANAMPRYLGPGETASGYVFTNNESGTKAFNVDIFYTGGKRPFEQFTFFVDVPGFTPDHAKVDFRSLYAPDEVVDVDVDGLRELLADMPCCTSNQNESAQGQPIEILIVAHGRELLQALLRADWSETSYQRDSDYLSVADHYLGRPPDAIFRKGRDNWFERNELGIWLAPVRVDGKPLWLAQIKHAIGRRYEIGENFLGVRLDPNINDGRNFLLQNLWYAESLQAYAWSNTGKRVLPAKPELDFKDNPWFSDGYRIVLWLSDKPLSLVEVDQIYWDIPKPLWDGSE